MKNIIKKKMMRILSKKESKQAEKDLNNWWQGLDFNIKNRIFDLLREPLLQRDCEHDWVKQKTTPLVYCKKCWYFKLKK